MIRGSFRLSLSAIISGPRGSLSSPDHDFTSFPRRNHSATSQTRTSLEPALKSYDDLPGNWRNNWVNAYRFWRNNGTRNSHNIMLDNFNKFGSIYRERIGNYDSVFVMNLDDVDTLFRAEDMYPERLSLKAWLAYKDYRKENYGILLKNGDDWRKNRFILNKALFAPQAIQKFVPLINDVALDFVSMVYRHIEKSRNGEWSVDLSNYLFKYTLQTICQLLYGERLHLLTNGNTESQQFINSILMLFKSTIPMLYIPPKLLKSINSKIWRDHVQSWDTIHAHANSFILKIHKEFQQGKGNDREGSGVLRDILQQDVLPVEDVKASIIDIMTGAIDTTSTLLLWIMYELANHPEFQENLRCEIMETSKKEGGDLVQMLKSVPLLRATLKETLRIHPVGITLQRYLKKDLVLQNYLLPVGTLVQLGLYAMGRNSNVFSNPEKFRPERWLEQERSNFANLAFGFGPRQCIGRRIAETKAFLFLIQMLQNFKIEYHHTADVEDTFHFILVPNKPIILTLKPIK